MGWEASRKLCTTGISVQCLVREAVLGLPQGLLLHPALLKSTINDLEKQVKSTLIKFPGDA